MRPKTEVRTFSTKGGRRPLEVKVLIVAGIAVGFSGYASFALAATPEKLVEVEGSYPIVDSHQGFTYGNVRQMDPPAKGEAFYGQDAQYTGHVPSYTDNGDGTITDHVSGLIWAQELSRSDYSWEEASSYCESLTLGGYNDWRLPTVKELWSLRDFSQGWPWVNTDYFHLVGDGSDQRQQHIWTRNRYWVESEYQNRQVQGDPSFIVNAWTGHIKAMNGKRFVRAVRGNTAYGINDFVDNGDGTVSDQATGLMWSQDDSGKGMNWEEALAYAEAATTAGYTDWRLPNVKELQSIADYSGVFPAMDSSVFKLTTLTNVKGQRDYPFYWSSTSNPIEGSDGAVESGSAYAWVLAAGYNTDPEGNDLHGAGSVVFVPKSKEYFSERDLEIHRYHYVRLVRGGAVRESPKGDPSVVDPDRVVAFKDGEISRGGPGGGARGERGRPDVGAAATKLGISEELLITALGDPQKGPPNFANAAASLGVTEAELFTALGVSKDTRPPEGKAPAERP
ncbi:DUF1566 domain-containing protein [Kiritimatiellota bacterium B12222]|nr:DUF1566 domain-containing protein [Kiritimatiellota bacterium B12222]